MSRQGWGCHRGQIVVRGRGSHMPQDCCAPFYLLRPKPRLAVGPLSSEISTPPGISDPG